MSERARLRGRIQGREGGVEGAKQGGLTILELMVAVSILFVISAGAFLLLGYFLKVYGTTSLKADMHSELRAASSLLAQEIGQAGVMSFTPTTLTQPVIAAGPSTVSVGSAAQMFIGQTLQVDLGTLQESVTVTAVAGKTVTTAFAKTHANGAPVYSDGLFTNGILSSSTATSLKMFGDINADGTLMYVRYDCDTTGAFTLSRSATVIASLNPIQPADSAPSQVLVDHLAANPGNTPCFQYTVTQVTPPIGANIPVITAVALTLTTQTAAVDPQTQDFDKETKTFTSLVPRNVQFAAIIVNNNMPYDNSMSTFMQATPPGLPLPTP